MQLKFILAALLSLVMTTPALSHAGDHHGMSLSQLAAHLVSSPLHASVFAGALLAFGLLVRFALKSDAVILRASDKGKR